MSDRFDVAVIGAGPAGSLSAYLLAEAGASVVLLDRAAFPRDKPCGGGLTARAVRLLPFCVTPVVEEVIDRFEIRLAYGRSVRRSTRDPLVYMTQRRRLDAFLAERAAEAGAEFRDRTRVASLDQDAEGVRVETSNGSIRAGVVVGADGANGLSAKALDLWVQPSYGVALEGNLPYGEVDRDRYRRRAVMEIGTVPGGYAWVFPKGDHVNFGVGGWEREGPNLRAHLDRLCREHGVAAARLQSVRGHRLPTRRPGAPLVGRRGLLVGDAAGLVDPWTGDGMFEAFSSARHAAGAIGGVLGGKAGSLRPYEAAVRRDLDGPTALAWDVKTAFERAPNAFFAAASTRLGWRLVERFMRRQDDSRRHHRLRSSATVAGLELASRALASPGLEFWKSRGR
jgi:geranylgeranyl reductase family protein